MTRPVPIDGGFLLDAVRFRTVTQPPWHLDKTDADSVVLLKSWHHLERELEILGPLQPRRMLELGIWEGGSAVAWPIILPTLERYSAIDLSERRPAFGPDVLAHPRFASVRLHPATSQDDREALDRIVAEDFDGPLDVVLDDASHQYEPSLRAFEILFPRLRPGGLYVIEDWSWAHKPGYQHSPWKDQPAMSNLVVRLALLAGSPGDVIRRLTVGPWLVVVERGPAELDGTFTVEGATMMGERRLGVF